VVLFINYPAGHQPGISLKSDQGNTNKITGQSNSPGASFSPERLRKAHCIDGEKASASCTSV
jgi:hypothetical protein